MVGISGCQLNQEAVGSESRLGTGDVERRFPRQPISACAIVIVSLRSCYRRFSLCGSETPARGYRRSAGRGLLPASKSGVISLRTTVAGSVLCRAGVREEVCCGRAQDQILQRDVFPKEPKPPADEMVERGRQGGATAAEELGSSRSSHVTMLCHTPPSLEFFSRHKKVVTTCDN